MEYIDLSKYLSKIDLTEEQAKQVKKENETTFYESGFEFLSKHKGLRPGCMHTIVGGKGVGKTSLLRSIISELSNQTNILYYSSEETIRAHQIKYSYNRPDEAMQRRVRYMCEQDIIGQDPKADLTKILEAACKTGFFQVIVYDNFTTAKLYENRTPAEQAEYVQKIKRICTANNKTFIAVFHPKKGSPSNITRMPEDCIEVRGSETPLNLSEYNYIIGKMFSESENKRYTILQTTKSRNHSDGTGIFFLLYDKAKEIYYESKEVGYNDLKLILKAQNERTNI